jgi:hypothetical protein
VNHTEASQVIQMPTPSHLPGLSDISQISEVGYIFTLHEDITIQTSSRNRFQCQKLLWNQRPPLQPFVFLDVFIGNDSIKDYQRRNIFTDDFRGRNNPLNQICDKDIIYWCDNDPDVRYPQIASAIQTFSELTEKSGLAWKPIVYSIFKKAPNLGLVLDHLADSIRPVSWSGSLANILQKRSVLFQSLYQHDNAEIRAWAKGQYLALQETIKREREWEKRRYRELNESFE